MTDYAKTPLHTLHESLGAKMVPFAGYLMPLHYPAGILQEHRHTRTQASLFDVSHMGQIRIRGTGAAQGLESLIPANLIDMQSGQQRYGLLTNDQGGILDDLMITRHGNDYLAVVNAACKQQDLTRLVQQLSELDITPRFDKALIALQGPAAGAVMSRLSPEVGRMVFMTGGSAIIEGIECVVTRSGYTGDDGFEIALEAQDAEAFARLLLAEPEVAPAGLGARDSLRLEAGLCLYGHDMDETTTPVEAALNWAIPKIRRNGGERSGGFPGADIILAQFTQGAARKRVGLQPEGRAPLREGVKLVDEHQQPVGHITSGGFGPTHNAPVAMGYVDSAWSKTGQVVYAQSRGKLAAVTVCTLPFVPHRYYRG